MQRHFVIASHNTLAQGMDDTLKFFTGNDDNIKVLTAYVDNTPIEDEVKHMLDNIPTKDEVVILTDLMGGSVNQKFFPFVYREHTHVITGMNLPLVMTLAMEPSEEYLSVERIQAIITEARNQLQYVNLVAQEQAGDDEDE